MRCTLLSCFAKRARWGKLPTAASTLSAGASDATLDLKPPPTPRTAGRVSDRPRPDQLSPASSAQRRPHRFSAHQHGTDGGHRMTPPPPQAPPRTTETCAATSGTIPLRLCVRRDLSPSPTKGDQRPELRRGLRGPDSPRWGNPACAAFARATPTAVVATRSAGVLPCAPAPPPPASDEVDGQTRP